MFRTCHICFSQRDKQFTNNQANVRNMPRSPALLMNLFLQSIIGFHEFHHGLTHGLTDVHVRLSIAVVVGPRASSH